MKKNYIAPCTDVCTIEAVNIMLATSIGIGIDGENADPNYPGGGDVKGQNYLWDWGKIW